MTGQQQSCSAGQCLAALRDESTECELHFEQLFGRTRYVGVACLENDSVHPVSLELVLVLELAQYLEPALLTSAPCILLLPTVLQRVLRDGAACVGSACIFERPSKGLARSYVSTISRPLCLCCVSVHTPEQ